MGFPTTMAHTSSSQRGAHTKTKNTRKPPSSSSSSDRAPLSSRLTAVSHLGHLAAFSPGVSAAGDYTSTPPRSPQPLASSGRGITRLDGTSVRPPPPSPLRGEYVTYHTNDLGLFEGQTADPLFGRAPPTLSNLFQTTSDAPQRPRLQGYQYTGGWTMNDNGQHVYVPMGNIREIPDEEEDNFLEVEGILDDLLSPQMLPPEATPPPRPQAGMSVLPSSVILSPAGWPTGTPAPSTVVIQPPQALPLSDTTNSVWQSVPQSSPTPASPTSSSSSPSSSSSSEDNLSSGSPPISPFNMLGEDGYGFAEFLEEEPIVTQNLQSIKRLCDNLNFLAPSRDDNGTCKLLIAALMRIKESLTRGLLIPNDLWKFLSDPKRVNFRNRLLSLRRTLTRLERVSTHLTFLRSERLAPIVSKLGDHHKKLSDIASKLDATFDLLDLYSLHEMASMSKRNSSAEHYLKARELYLLKKPSRSARDS